MGDEQVFNVAFIGIGAELRKRRGDVGCRNFGDDRDGIRE